MKHLKLYKIFEYGLSQYFEPNVIKLTEEVMADIKDILLDLSDINYQTNVDYAPFLRHYLTYKAPVIQIIITKPQYDPEINSGFKFSSLWETEDEKIYFDDIILKLLKYTISKGYKYEFETTKNRTWRNRVSDTVVKYKINIYKEE
jgi:hypothetical protein